MQRMLGVGVLLLACLLILPALASAQSQITGLVKDESGAVLPGATVEAASPVLIEKMKSAVTDDQGHSLFPSPVTFSGLLNGTLSRDSACRNSA